MANVQNFEEVSSAEPEVYDLRLSAKDINNVYGELVHILHSEANIVLAEMHDNGASKSEIIRAELDYHAKMARTETERIRTLLDFLQISAILQGFGGEK